MKTAVVTGAASGLGLEFSKLLAEDGYTLLMVDVDAEKLQAVKADLKNTYSVAIEIIPMDLAQRDSADTLYEKTKEYHPEVVINNAGFGLGGPFSNIDWDLQEKMMNLHMYTPTRYSKLVIPDMIKNGKGKILNMASIAAFTPGPFMMMYYATKAYLFSFSRAISSELRGTGVSATVICPGLVKTAFAQSRAKQAGVAPPKYGIMADSAEHVTRVAYAAMHKGKSVSIPGFKSKFLTFVMWLAPKKWGIALVRKQQAKLNDLDA